MRNLRSLFLQEKQPISISCLCSNSVSNHSFRRILVTQPNEQKQLTTFKDVQTTLMAGEEIRWIVKIIGCKCPPDPLGCMDSSFGDTIKGRSCLIRLYPLS